MKIYFQDLEYFNLMATRKFKIKLIQNSVDENNIILKIQYFKVSDQRVKMS